jgi:putative acetyltransferase
MILRDESPSDHAAIGALTALAFAGMPYSDQSEPQIIERLRAAAALLVSLVAEEDGEIIGHCAFSPVTLSTGVPGWYGLGPVSVHPDKQGRGIGQALIEEGLHRLRACHAAGCVVLGDPAYYGRFGFRADPALVLPDVPAEYFQILVLHGPAASGIVAFHPGFYGAAA